MRNDNENNSRSVLYENNLFHEAVKMAALLDGERLFQENKELNADAPGVSIEKQKEFRNKLDKALRNKQNNNRRFSCVNSLQKIAVIALIATAVLSISLLSVEAFRTRIFNFFMEVKPEFTEFRLEESSNNTKDSWIIDWENAYLPTYIPAGYQVESSENGETFKSILLINAEGKIIDYAQYFEDASFNYDTEDANTQDITINGEAGTLILKEGHYSIVWMHENMIFVVMTQINEVETKKIAESVKFIK